jgi:hypothetical protein
VSGHHPIHRGPKQNKKAKEESICSPFLSYHITLSCPCPLVLYFSGLWTQTRAYTDSHPGSQVFRLELEHIASSPSYPDFITWANSHKMLHAQYILFVLFYLSIYLSIYLPILSVLFLWRILTNTITIIKSFHISHRTMMFLTHHFWSVAFWAEFSNSAWEICYYSPVTITNAKKWKVVLWLKKRKFVEGCIWITSPYSSGILWLRASTPLITALAPPWTSEDNAGITHFIAL